MGARTNIPKAGKIPTRDTFDWSILKMSPLGVEAAIVELCNSVATKSAENVAEGKTQSKAPPAGKDKDKKGARPTNTAPVEKVGPAPPRPPEEFL